MQRLFKSFVFLLLLSPTLAAEKSDVIDIDPTHITIEIPQEKNKIDTKINMSEEEEFPVDTIQVSHQNSLNMDEHKTADLEQGENPDKIDTLEEVEDAGCAICCLRTGRAWSTGAAGLFGFLGGLGNTTKTALITLSALGEYSPSLKRYLGITSTVVSAATLITSKVSDATLTLALSNQKKLQDIEDQINAVLAKYRVKPVSPLFKTNHLNLSNEDQKTITDLQERYENITNLSDCEKSCFSYLNNFFSCTSTFSQIMEFICNAANLVMVPLATLPVWDPQTAQALNISVIVIEGGSVFFNKWSQQAQTTNKAMTNLKNKLDQYN